MKSIVRTEGVALVGLVALALGAGGGCGGEANDPGLRDMQSTVAPDAPKSMQDFYNQQQGGAAKASP